MATRMADEPTRVNLTSAAIPAEGFDGSWERKGRSPNSAALAGLLGVGIIYFYGQGFLVSIALLGTGGHLAGESEGFFQELTRIAELTKNPVRTCLILSQFLLMLWPTWWLVRRWHTSDVRGYIRLNYSSTVQVVLAFCTVLLLFPTNILISEFFINRLSIPEEMVRINEAIVTASSGGEFVFVVLVIAVTPAICEEVLFRGYAQRTFERTMGWKSIIVVGVLFGLYHMQPLGLLSLSGLGLLFGYFFFASKSLVPGMVAHFTNNFLVVLWMYLRETQRMPISLRAGHLMPVVMLVTLPSAAIAIYAFHRASVRTGSPETVPPPEGQAKDPGGMP